MAKIKKQIGRNGEDGKNEMRMKEKEKESRIKLDGIKEGRRGREGREGLSDLVTALVDAENSNMRRKQR